MEGSEHPNIINPFKYGKSLRQVFSLKKNSNLYPAQPKYIKRMGGGRGHNVPPIPPRSLIHQKRLGQIGLRLLGFETFAFFRVSVSVSENLVTEKISVSVFEDLVW